MGIRYADTIPLHQMARMVRTKDVLQNRKISTSSLNISANIFEEYL
jgi:hypothetical protein